MGKCTGTHLYPTVYTSVYSIVLDPLYQPIMVVVVSGNDHIWILS